MVAVTRRELREVVDRLAALAEEALVDYQEVCEAGEYEPEPMLAMLVDELAQLGLDLQTL